MRNRPEQNEERRIIRGKHEIAEYKEIPLELAEYRDNPFIEALPHIWNWEGDEPKVVDELTQYFATSESIRQAPLPIRQHKLGTFKFQFFQVLNRVRDLEVSLSILLRQGYLARNPMNPRYRRNLHDRLEKLTSKPQNIISVGNLGLTLLGAPGQGKTRSLERILLLYPQVIHHQKYPKDPTFTYEQVVWLYLTCSHDKSTRGLCLMFFQEVDDILGTDFLGEYAGENENVLIAGMATVASLIGLGVLVVDEIEFLSAGKSGGKDDLLKFFVQLENTLRIVVVLVGTNKAAKFLASTPHQARRSVGTGGAIWLPLQEDDPDWACFLEAMWEHQYLMNYTPLNPDLAKVVYDESRGILNYAVDLHYYAQFDAMNNKTEALTAESIRSAARNHLIFNRPYVDALKNPQKRFMRLLEDIFPPDFESCQEFFKDELVGPPGPQKPIDLSSLNSSNEPSTQTSSTSTASISSFQAPGPSGSVTGQTPLPPKRKRSAKQDYPVGSIMAICAEAYQKDGKAPYEALKDAGLIVNPSIFLIEQ